MKVTIDNFQSIEHCELEIPEGGFTCMVGPSNIGKSSFRRAMQCLFYNQSQASYIRNGKSFCSVEIVLDDGTTIKWTRDKKSSMYEINGETYTKLSRGVPDILVEKGFQELILNKDKFSIQIASQFPNIFLLNQSGSKITEVLSNLGSLNRIIGANKSCLSDIKANKSRLNLRRGDLLAEKEKVKNFRGIDVEVSKIDDVKSDFFKLEKEKEVLEKCRGFAEVLERKKRLLIQLVRVKDLAIPSYSFDVSQWNSLNSLEKKYVKSCNSVGVYASLKEINEVALRIDLSNYTRLSDLYKKAKEAQIRIANYKDVPENISQEEISLDVIKKLKDFSKDVLKSRNSIVSLRKGIEKAEKRLVSLKKEEQEVKDELGVCPLCEKEF